MLDTGSLWTHRLRTLPIATKLAIVSALVVLALVTLPQVSWHRDSVTQHLNQTRLAIKTLDNILLDMQRSEENFLHLHEPRFRHEFDAAFDRLQAHAADLRLEFADLGLSAETLEKLTEKAAQYRHHFMALPPPPLPLNHPWFIQGGALVDATMDTLTRLNGEVEAAVEERVRQLNIFLGLLSGFFLAAFLATVVMLSRSIVGPIRNVTSIMTRLADGDLSVTIPDRTRQDEIGDMLRALRVFKMGAIIRRRTQEELRKTHDELEKRVEERTHELSAEVQEHRRTEKELERAREEAESANRAKSMFLANMSHELRTPLNAIIGYAEILQEDAEELGYTDLVADMDKIHAAGKHLLGIINEILDLSKIEAGHMHIHVEEFFVDDLLETVVNTIQPLIAVNDNIFNLDIPEDLGAMESDITRVRQILFNFLSNAAKFTHEGTITLKCRRETTPKGDTLAFSVSDTGIGMTEEQLKRVFLPFTQADASTTRKYGGTGLGLTVNREFSHLLGGEIEVDSTPDVGTTFTARLPAVSRDVLEDEDIQLA